MAITYFECRGFKKLLALRNTQSVIMEPRERLQWILGTNGSGKSALMGELSPLLADHSQYVRGEGLKRFVGTHKNHEYDCLCDFRGTKNHYSIHRDGVELYSGHSSTMYQDQIEKEFGLTPDIHAVRIGSMRFSRMTTAERRSWLTKLCPEDYSYAIGYYKRLSEATRDISGTIKRVNSRLMAEKARLIDAEEEARLRSDIAKAIETKNEMMRHWRPMETSVESSLLKVQEIDSKLLEMEANFNRMYKIFSNREGYKSQQEIWDQISATQSEITYCSRKIDELCEVITKNTDLLNQVSAAAHQDTESIRKEIADISRDIIQLRLAQKNDEWDGDPAAALAAYDGVFLELVPLMTELTPDPDHRNKESHYREALAELELYQTAINRTRFEQVKAQERLDTMLHRKNEKHVTCPKCYHAWPLGYSEESEARERKDIAELGDSEAGLVKEYEALKTKAEQSLYQIQLIDRISMFIRTYPALTPLWRTFAHQSLLRSDPAKALAVFNATRSDIEISKSIKEKQERKEELTQVFEAAKTANGINQQEIRDSNAVMEAQLVSLQTTRRSQTLRLEYLRSAQQAMDFQERYVPLAEDMVSQREQWIRKAELANHHTAVNSIVMSLDAEIVEKERLLNQISAQHQLIKTLEMEVSDCVTKEKTMKRALLALSPSQGLIAKGLTGFINHFIAQMNAVIEKVWLYPLTIDPIALTDDTAIDLDYKFSFHLHEKPAGKDVNQGSGAQQEIFDLAFMLVSMVHLGLEESEVFLDEFSIKMDHAHRKEAMKMVTDLVHSSNFSQIFMISHYESNYSSMANSDITVLCPENIMLPPDLKYNTRSKVE